MTLLKKINPEWHPAENPGLKVGETIDFDNYFTLVREGHAVIVDEEGNELLPPGTYLTCPICFKKLPGVLKEFTAHVETSHTPKKTVTAETAIPEGLAPTPVEKAEELEELLAIEESPELTTQQKKEAALAKARLSRATKAAKGETV